MWPNPQFPADLVTFTEEILNGRLHFLCSDPKASPIFLINWNICSSLWFHVKEKPENHILSVWLLSQVGPGFFLFIMFFAILYHFYNLKYMKNTQASACNFTKSNTSPWAYFTFCQLYNWCQIVQSISFVFIFYLIFIIRCTWIYKLYLPVCHFSCYISGATFLDFVCLFVCFSRFDWQD